MLIIIIINIFVRQISLVTFSAKFKSYLQSMVQIGWKSQKHKRARTQTLVTSHDSVDLLDSMPMCGFRMLVWGEFCSSRPYS